MFIITIFFFFFFSTNFYSNTVLSVTSQKVCSKTRSSLWSPRLEATPLARCWLRPLRYTGPKVFWRKRSWTCLAVLFWPTWIIPRYKWHAAHLKQDHYIFISHSFANYLSFVSGNREILSWLVSAQRPSFICENEKTKIEIDSNKRQLGFFNNFCHQKGSVMRCDFLNRWCHWMGCLSSNLFEMLAQRLTGHYHSV